MSRDRDSSACPGNSTGHMAAAKTSTYASGHHVRCIRILPPVLLRFGDVYKVTIEVFLVHFVTLLHFAQERVLFVPYTFVFR